MNDHELSTPDWLADAIFYQIFPERFANGDATLNPEGVEEWGAEPTRDNFFGGDLKGITEHLDHIEAVGANAIYLTPIFEADTNHRYDAKDYFKIDHRLGDLEAFRTFLSAAHDRGIRVVLDAVLNHCGDGHWAFRDVVEKEADSEYVNWYYVEDFPIQSHPEPNYRTCSGCYYLPKWNAHNPEVRDHHYKVAQYWIEQGIDGWRLDVPYFLNDNFWRGFRKVVKGIDPDLYIVAEEWRSPEQWLNGDLADGTMNYTLRDLILGYTADRTVTAADYAAGMNELRNRVPDAARPAMLNLLGSHDTERVLTRHREDLAAAKLAYVLLLTAEGAPMLYYGDELGLVGGNDPACRGTMPWNQGDWNTELLASVQRLTAARKNLEPLRRGAQHVVAIGDDVVLVLRHSDSGRVLVAVNRGTTDATLAPESLSGEAFSVQLPTARWTSVLDAAEYDLTDAFVVPAQSAILLSTEGTA
ncbi:MAG: alpha-amylase [Cryobacterium sp.]|jgi:cyclomaltodextrinase|nr:alpha-amylase [Cryobacterium sp.]